MNLQEVVDKAAVAPEEDPFTQMYAEQTFVDDIHGGIVDKKLATEARRLEI